MIDTRRSSIAATLAVFGAMALAGCEAPAGSRAGGPSRTPGLAGTTWQLVQFQSSDDTIGTVRPDDPSKYEMTLGADGRVGMTLDCNRAGGRWSATPSAGATHGAFAFTPLVVTRAACRTGSLDTKIARDAGFVRGYVLEGDRLHLSLMADGGIYTWRRTGTP
jgi:heat shock protein HslJ